MKIGISEERFEFQRINPHLRRDPQSREDVLVVYDGDQRIAAIYLTLEDIRQLVAVATAYLESEDKI